MKKRKKILAVLLLFCMLGGLARTTELANASNQVVSTIDGVVVKCPYCGGGAVTTTNREFLRNVLKDCKHGKKGDDVYKEYVLIKINTCNVCKKTTSTNTGIRETVYAYCDASN